MRLLSLRRGFATNSSSAHGVILLPSAKDDHQGGSEEQTYGWEPFTLATQELKRRYIAQQLFAALDLPTEAAVALVEAWVGVVQAVLPCHLNRHRACFLVQRGTRRRRHTEGVLRDGGGAILVLH